MIFGFHEIPPLGVKGPFLPDATVPKSRHDLSHRQGVLPQFLSLMWKPRETFPSALVEEIVIEEIANSERYPSRALRLRCVLITLHGCFIKQDVVRIDFYAGWLLAQWHSFD